MFKKITTHKKIREQIAKLPLTAGVYLFKDAQNQVIYIGKAKKLRNRVKSYLLHYGTGVKETAILDTALTVEYVLTQNELEALLLEAQLIQSYQPMYNVLLRDGQPYTYFLITSEQLPRFELARNKKRKGVYFGPFIEKTAARRAHQFLLKTFQLQLCNKKMPNGCLAYHMGKCAGNCKDTFDKQSYLERLNLIKEALATKNRADFLQQFNERIAASNKELTFEKSAQLLAYKKAFEHVFASLAVNFDRPQSLQKLADKDIWFLYNSPHSFAYYLFLYRERNGVTQKNRVFGFSGNIQATFGEYIYSYYRTYGPAQQIISNKEIPQKDLLAAFINQWHRVPYTVSISTCYPGDTHARLIELVRLQAEKEIDKREYSGSELKRLLSLKKAPQTIDCFDISHKQGYAQVGSCVRFENGQPAPDKFRHFIIKSQDTQNDYAALQEVVSRRYFAVDQLPDLIVIDGGKGQLSAVAKVIAPILAGTQTDLVSLAKREETIFSSHLPDGKKLNPKSVSGQLLIALRDYAHHFALSFHRKRFEKSILD